MTIMDCGQLYVFYKVGGADSLVSRVNACIVEIDVRMSSNRLKLNSNKTQLIWFGSQQRLNKVNINSINLLGSTVNFQSSVINLGATINERPCAANLPYVILPTSSVACHPRVALS